MKAEALPRGDRLRARLQKYVLPFFPLRQNKNYELLWAFPLKTLEYTCRSNVHEYLELGCGSRLCLHCTAH